jgi:flagellar FliL protein
MKADPKADAPAAQASTKKLILLVAISALVVGAGGGGAWYFLRPHEATPVHKAASTEPPKYIPIDSFTVNLQPENGEQYLQIAFTLQVPTEKDGEVIKDNMAKVRSRLLLLLSGHKASEISSVDGKKLLSKEIMGAVNQPFVDKGEQQKVSDVLFTAFIIQ